MKKYLVFIILFSFFCLASVNAQVVFTEDFENAGAIPAGWTQEFVSGTHNWNFLPGASGGSVVTAYSGSYNAQFHHNSHSGYKTKLVSPELDLNGLPSPSLNFWHAQENYLGDQDTLRLYYKTSVSGQWNLLETWSNSISAWTLQTIELPNPTSTYYFAFEGAQAYGHGVVIDDVFVLESSEYAFQVNPKKTLIRQWVEHDTTFLIEVQNTGLQDDTLDFNPINANWTTAYRDKYDTAPISWMALDSGVKDTFLIKVSVPLSAELHELDTAFFSLTSRAMPSKTQDSYVVTRAYSRTPVPIYEDWEFLPVPNSWLVDTYGMFFGLQTGINPIAHSGAYKLYANTESATGDSSRVYLMCDLSSSSQTEFRYWMYHTNTNQANNDSVYFQYSFNGKKWYSMDTVVHRYRADGNYWEEHIVDVSTFDGDTIWFGLLACSASGERIFFDDFYIGPRPSENLIISEIMYNSPETGQDSLEFIEIYNNGIYPLDIGNYQIGYNSTYQTMNYGIEVDPYKSIVLATDSIAFSNFYGFPPTIEWTATNQLDDHEAAIWIKDNNGILLDTVFYRDTLPWPNMAAGNGASLALCDLLVDNNDGNNWHYSMIYVDTIANGMEVWASPGQPNTASCNYYDIAIINPSTEVHDSLYYCEMPSPIYDTLSLEITNRGVAEMIIGDTIFMSYQINAAAVVYDTIVLSAPFAPGDIITVQFQQTYDFSADGVYEIQYEAYPILDAYPVDNEAILSKINFVVDVDLPGVNDTLETLTYPVTLDAGVTTSGGWPYATWNWSTTETSQTIDVSADGWYYVTVTTAVDSAGNQCSVIDSVYVILAITDIAFSQPPATHGNDFYFCELPNNMDIDFLIENQGKTVIPAGDTIFASYQFDANPVVLDTFVLSSDIDTAAVAAFTFSQTVDLSVDGDYDYILTINYENDVNLLNDTSSGTLHNFVVDVDLPGVNDTLETLTYPVTLDAGATTSGGWPYATWNWSTTETSQTIDVSADGWYYVTVTTAVDSAGNQCSVIDSVYVHNVSAIEEINNNFSIFPNPNNGKFIIRFEREVFNAALSIVNVQGQLLLEKEVNHEMKLEFNLNDFARGIYFIKCTTAEGTIVKKMIIE